MKKAFGVALDYLLYIIGCLVFAFSVNVLLAANEISPGGFAGISTLLEYLIGIPSGIALFIFNIPILVVAYFSFGGSFIIRTSIVTVILSSAMTVTAALPYEFSGDTVLACVFGGIGMGVGMSMVLLRGATTGGVDIIAKLVNRKFPHFTVGRVILIFDVAVVVLAAVVYRNIESALYSVVAMFVATRVMDIMLYGADKGKLLYIVSSCYDEICSRIALELSRGVTVVEAKGGYTNKPRPMLMCVVRRHEVATIYRIVRQCDKSAFITVLEAGEILGEGFKTI